MHYIRILEIRHLLTILMSVSSDKICSNSASDFQGLGIHVRPLIATARQAVANKDAEYTVNLYSVKWTKIFLIKWDKQLS